MDLSARDAWKVNPHRVLVWGLSANSSLPAEAGELDHHVNNCTGHLYRVGQARNVAMAAKPNGRRKEECSQYVRAALHCAQILFSSALYYNGFPYSGACSAFNLLWPPLLMMALMGEDPETEMERVLEGSEGNDQQIFCALSLR